ncbi:carboxypeptidase regulatory-like domain-containing protein [Fodinibius sp.]|uniref:carboxypeptidase regulatory-like domain-containing protein n=1 Tax=Fodinibius sp. TaxID=1872440 RepID=UPI002ACDF644|nr:carboxypeptidase regulatory-like domain-containing protein [Fodinibius sp.]MDZ7660308.1 carboxypeptidase regulatory-like domain-containing protein [Fodinibius sp.]
MKNRLFLLFPLAMILLIQACGTDDSVIIAGQVIEASSGNPVSNAIVELTQPENLRQTATTDSAGNFSFDVDPGSETVNVTLEIDKQGYQTQTTNFKLAPDTDVDDLVIELQSTDSSGGDGDDGGDEVGGEPEGPAAIILQSISDQAIFIKETGDNISSAFTFQVVDSAGRAINAEGAVDVNFEILSGPGGDEEIIPKTATTNSNGQATTSLFSGNVAGPVKVQASVEREDLGVTIKSTPVLVAIHGGFPDPDHFSISPEKFNFEAYDINGVRNSVTVIVGDKFSNPVKPGTVVYFNSTGGIIQGSGQTDADGTVTVDMISGEPRPDDNIPGSGGRPGYSTVTATTVDENDNRISKEINVVFSTRSAQISATPTTFDLDPNGGENFSYTVTDMNGNPMAAGTQITVEAGEGMEVTGDVDFTLGNHLFPGPGATEFNFSIRDTDDETNDPADLTINISVTTPSGNTTTYTEISGTRRKSF